MFASQSILGVSAAGLYLVVMAACLAAALTARAQRQAREHSVQWLLLLALFAALVLLRMFDWEESFRQATRGALRSDGTYAMRRDLQRPIAGGLIALFSVIISFAVYRFAQRGGGRRNIALALAGTAGLIMLGLVGLRTVSLHQIDRLLYGPLKLNWLFDIGSSLAVLGAAVWYLGLLTRRR